MTPHSTRFDPSLQEPASAPAPEGPATRFVVVGTQRSGTTFLRQCLDSHPHIRCRGELFARSYGKEEGYHAYRRASLWRAVGHYAWRSRQVREFLDLRMARLEIGVDAVGFKLMRSHVRRVPYLYPMLLPLLHREGYRVVHVIRRNLLRVLVSRRTALARGQFHARKELPAIEVALDVKTLARELESLAEENRFWTRATGSLQRLEVEYEAFVEDREGQSRRMLEFLGVDPQVPLHSPHKQVNRAALARILRNYEEVAEVLAGTAYARFLDD